VRTFENTSEYTGADILAILAGWQAQPQHRAIEVEAVELLDLAERDAAARVTFQRGAGR
jgi:hypothetical protein